MRELDFDKIGQRLKEIRLEKGLKQEDIARQTYINTSHVSNFETGKTKISLTLLTQVCDVLGVTIDYVLQNEYLNSSTAIENELIYVIQNLPKEKQEILLRIAKVL